MLNRTASEFISWTEHLLTFSLQNGEVQGVEEALARLSHLAKADKLWSQCMVLEVAPEALRLLDIQTKEELESYPVESVYRCDPIFSVKEFPSLLLLVCRSSDQEKPDILFFSCETAKQISDDITAVVSAAASKGKTDAQETLRSSQRAGKMIDPYGIPTHPIAHAPNPPPANPPPYPGPRANGMNGGPDITFLRADRDVRILNHCFDDMESFMAKLQQAAEAASVLNQRKKKKKKSKKQSAEDDLLTAKARPPPEEEFRDIFQKFKYSFCLLARLKSAIANPTSGELVHYVFKPLDMVSDPPPPPPHHHHHHHRPHHLLHPSSCVDGSTPPAPADRLYSCSYDFVARNSSELSVQQGDTLEVIESSKRWWKCRNRFNEVGFVPSNILEPAEHIDTLLPSQHSPKVPAPPPAMTLAKTFPAAPPMAPLATPSHRNQSPVQRPRSMHLYSQHIPAAEDSEKGVSCPHLWLRTHLCSTTAGSRRAPGLTGRTRLRLVAPARDGSTPPAPADRLYSCSYDFVARNSSELSVQQGDTLEVIESSKRWWKCRNRFNESPVQRPRSMHLYSQHIPAAEDSEKVMQVNDELLQRLTNGRSNLNKPSLVIPRSSETSVPLDYHSPPDEVARWLRGKGFTEPTVQCLGVLTGAQLFSLNKEELRAVIPEEGARVYSQLTVQKALLEDARNATELEAVMEKQKMKVDLKSQATTTTL
ncbi:hypothetical protein CRUP_017151 [Coryphaenoides rupestris]|nr:hypothetical protein CRUP_017151 [Coryphaenoides rupestris]